MNTKDTRDRDTANFIDEGFDEEEAYDDLELLERLESLREDMEELGVTTLSEVIERIATLHRQLDEQH